MTKPTGKKRGRPPNTNPNQVLSIRLPVEVVAWLDTQANMKGIAKATWVADFLIKIHKKNTGG